MLICILALVLGICLALFLPIVIPQGLMQFFGLIVLDILVFTVFSVNSRLKKTLNIKIFISGFIITALIAVGAAFIGEKLDLRNAKHYVTALFDNKLITSREKAMLDMLLPHFENDSERADVLRQIILLLLK